MAQAGHRRRFARERSRWCHIGNDRFESCSGAVVLLWISGDGDGARVKAAKKTSHKLQPRLMAQEHAPPGLDVLRDQTRNRPRLLVKRPVRQCALCVVDTEEGIRHLFRLADRTVPQDLRQCQAMRSVTIRMLLSVRRVPWLIRHRTAFPRDL
jgi:hypothetical protein